MPRLTGTICWFDATSGEGVVRGDDGGDYYLHFSSIAGIDKHNYQWPTERDQGRLRGISGHACTFERYPANYTERADKCAIAGLNDFPCCGGNDEDPPDHCMDCPVSPPNE
jgi:hypothetical protein